MSAITPPPHDVESEAALIASVLTSDEFLSEAVGMVPDESLFYRDAHAKLWRIVLDFHAKGQELDPVIVAAECGRRGISFEEETSPFTALGFMLHEHPLNWKALEYASNVLRAARLRSVIETANGMLRDAYANRDEPDVVLSRAIATLKGEESKSVAEVVTAASLIPSVVRAIDERAAGRLTGIITPFQGLNALTGGLHPQDLVVVAARTSMGKTSFALNLAAFVGIDLKLPTLVVSLEMGNPLLVERVLSFRSGVHAMSMRTGRLDRHESMQFLNAQRELFDSPLYLSHKTGRTLNRIVSGIRRAHARMGLKLILIDYIQQIGTGRNTSLYESTTLIAKELKDLANDLEVPIVALSQLSREAPKREDKHPKMTDLRDSGAIEEAADLILLLHRPEYYEPGLHPGLAELSLAKNRNGPPGDLRLTFHKEIMRFEDEVIPIAEFGNAPY